MHIEVWLFVVIVLLAPALGSGLMWGLVKRFSTRSLAKAAQEAERVVAAAKAQADGYFAEEIVDVETPGGKAGPIIVNKDEHLRPETTMDGLMASDVAEAPESAVTTNFCKRPVLTLVSGCTSYTLAMVMMSPARNVVVPVSTVIDAPG